MSGSLGEPRESPAPRRATGRAALLLQATLEYGPFAAAAILLILTTLADQVPRLASILPPSMVGLYVCVTFLSLLAFVLRLTDRVNGLVSAVETSTETQLEVLGSVRPAISQVSLGHAFHVAERLAGQCDRIRIYAITSKFVSQHMQPRDFTSQEMQLLLGAANAEKDPLLASEVHLSVLYTWVGHVRSGATRSMAIRQYDFYPTEWFVVFDDKLMIMGNYVYDRHSIGKALTTPDAYLVRADKEGRQLISTKVNSFDALFGAASSEFGNGPYEGEYRLVDGTVRWCQLGDEDWIELGPISQSALPRQAEI